MQGTPDAESLFYLIGNPLRKEGLVRYGAAEYMDMQKEIICRFKDVS